MTTTDLPCNYSVPLHQEMAYADGAPDIVAFFCEVPAPVGGETTVGDMRRITRSIKPDVIERFENHNGLQVRRSLAAANDQDPRKTAAPRSSRDSVGGVIAVVFEGHSSFRLPKAKIFSTGLR